MNELRSAGFSAHPSLTVSHVLNLHLQDNVTSRSKFETLEKKVGEVEKIAKEAKKLADKKGGPNHAAAATAGGGN